MRLAHGFRFRQRDWSIIAYYNGKVIAGADLRAIVTRPQASELFREYVSRLLINLGIHNADADQFATLPYRNLPKLSGSVGVSLP